MLDGSRTSVHAVYVYGVPLIVLGQIAAMAIFLHHTSEWMVIAHWLIS